MFSDHFTTQEWNAMYYYVGHGPSSVKYGCTLNAFHAILAAVLVSGYTFSGLDINGKPTAVVDVDGANLRFAQTESQVNFQANSEDAINALIQGREWVKVNAPSFLSETDEQWTAIVDDLKKQTDLSESSADYGDTLAKMLGLPPPAPGDIDDEDEEYGDDDIDAQLDSGDDNDLDRDNV